MSLERRPSSRTLRCAAVGVGLALAATGGAPSAAGEDRAPAEALLSIASDEPLVVRFASPVPASRVGSTSFRVVREKDGEPASGRYVAGTFLLDRTTSRAVVVDPQAYAEAVQVVRGLDAASARTYVDRILQRHAQSGRARDFEPLRGVLRTLSESMPGGPHFEPNLDDELSSGLRMLPQQDETAPAAARSLRKIQAGDDALWERYILGNDVSAFLALTSDPTASRFHHSLDPLTGQTLAESDFRRQEHRRYLFTGAHTGRVFTFVPDVPETPQLADIAFTANDRFRVTFAGLPNPTGGLSTTSGFRATVRRRVAHVETTNPNHGQSGYARPVLEPEFLLSELNDAPFRVIDVTPPNGERLVDPATDWENPDNRFTVPLPQRRPFVVRVRFNQPLDPRTVTPTTFTLTQRRAAIGTANERPVSIAVPVDVRLHQKRLGDVEVEVAPKLPLDPAAEYEVDVRNLTRTLDRRSNITDRVTRFTTAPIEGQFDAAFEDFSIPQNRWLEADTTSRRPLVAADAAHDPSGLGLFIPFLGSDPKPVTAIESMWFDSSSTSPRYLMRLDNPATPQLEGTRVHAPAGSTVRIFARTAPVSLQTNAPDAFLIGPWTEMDAAHPQLLGGRFLMLRVEFTLQPGATPATTDLPYVDAISVMGIVP